MVVAHVCMVEGEPPVLAPAGGTVDGCWWELSGVTGRRGEVFGWRWTAGCWPAAGGTQGKGRRERAKEEGASAVIFKVRARSVLT